MAWCGEILSSAYFAANHCLAIICEEKQESTRNIQEMMSNEWKRQTDVEKQFKELHGLNSLVYA